MKVFFTFINFKALKRISIFILFCIFILNVRAQELFYQDFESGVLAPMTAVDVDGKILHPSMANIAGPTFQVVQQDPKNKCVVSASWFTPVGQADDWLISPPILVTDTNTFLSWRAYSPDGSYRDGYQVLISTTDTALVSFSQLALNVPAEMTTWIARNIKLGTYVGQTIYFAFRNNSNDKYLLYLDDIKVEILKNTEVVVEGVFFEKYNAVNEQVLIHANILNHGAIPITAVILDFVLENNFISDTFYGLNILPYRSITLSPTRQVVHSSPGEYRLTCSAYLPKEMGDGNPVVSSASKNIYFLEEPVQKKIVVEESCGTWCGWCPRGIVFTKLVAENYPGIVVPIHVHNSDPMVLPEYDVPLSSALGTLYPYGFVDRKAGPLNPEYFPNEVEALLNRLVPVALSTQVTWDESNRTASIKGTGHLTIPTESNALRFTCVITENNVTGTTSGYEQVNFYAGGAAGIMGGYESLPNPVPANQMIYDFVSRALLGGYEGMDNSIPDSLEANEDFEVEFTYTVPEEFDVTQMHAIIFILDEETGEILNSDRVKLSETTAVPLVPAGYISAFPNPATDILNLQIEYSTDAKVNMRIYTPLGQLVRDLGTLDLTNGNHTIQIKVADLSSGNYILELRNKNSVTALPFTKM
jgi:thiol-disulfide isomerase/thioredoxin